MSPPAEFAPAPPPPPTDFDARRPWRRVLYGIAAVSLLASLAWICGLSGCGGSSEPPRGFGEGTIIDKKVLGGFELIWKTYDQLTEFKLIRTRDPNETSSGLIQEPLKSDDPNVANPKEMIFVHSITLPQARDHVVFLLENWMADRALPSGWKPDPLVDDLRPYVARDNLELERLKDPKFDYRDFNYLQQCIWAYKIVDWSQQSAVGPLAEAAIAHIEATQPDDSQDLVTAVRLFDWTVRNIQLDPLLPEPNDVAAAPGGSQMQTSPRSGIPGPGYTMEPWQVLLYGHGDAWQRARVFAMLARQADIDVVILAESDPGPAGKHKPWLPAALIGGKLYLFDTALGLPIPGPDGKGVATLDDVESQPELLRNLDVDDSGETLTYPMTADKLSGLVALIDAEAPALSYRMQEVEEQLRTTNAKNVPVGGMALTVSPSKLRERLGKRRVHLWNVSFTATQYQVGRSQRAARALQLRETDPNNRDLEGEQMATELTYEHYVYGTMLPTCTGRYLHLVGRFEPRIDEPGAMKWYVDALASDADIAKLKHSTRLQAQAGMAKHPEESDEEHQQRLESFASFLRRIKRLVTIWLAQASYELDQFPSSENWLNKIDVEQDDPVYAAVQLNLARAYEADGLIDKARYIYLLDQSPQKHGSRIRARLLREQQLETEAPQDAAPKS